MLSGQRPLDGRATAGNARSGVDRALLLSFVDAGERAKAAFERGATAEAHRLYTEALEKAKPLAHRHEVQEVVAKFQARLVETRDQETRPSSSTQWNPELEATVRDLEVPKGASGVRWEDVVGLNDAKRALWEAVVLPSLNPELFTGLRAPPRGILLYGPPGNGKTLLAKAAAQQCSAAFFTVSASALTSKWHGDTEKLVRALFVVARERAPSIVFLDELDSVLSSRSSSESEVGRRLKTEFLVQLDGVQASKENGERVVVLGATNRPFDLDEAVLRRFAVQVHIPLPDVPGRQALLQAALRQHRHSLSEADFAEVARRLEGYSFSDITNLCREASMAAIRELPAERVVRLTADQLRPITPRDFQQALVVVQPTTSADAASELQRWASARSR